MNIAILLAAGSSTRAGENKLWAEVHGRPLWTLSYETLVNHPWVERLVLVVAKGQEFRFLPFVENEKVSVVVGGETRMDSFKKGLASLELKPKDVVLDHNAANPFVTAEEISAVLTAAQKEGAAAVAQLVVDTVAEVDSTGAFITDFHDRSHLRLMQTPQAARGDILDSIDLAGTTDLASALLGYSQVRLLPASPFNKKVTFASDLLALRSSTFFGEDSHRFGAEGALTLGGLTVPDCPATEAHSDGDVILHAIGRALAAARGASFSDAADALCEAGEKNSSAYLAPLLEGQKLLRLQLSLECARPKIDPLIPALKKNLSQLLGLHESNIHVSAMTGEALTSFGRGEGIRCTALIQLQHA